MGIFNYDLGRSSLFIPIIGGSFIALAATVLLRLPYVWAGLVTVGLAVCVLSLIAKDFKSYWLAIFAIALPLNIKKMLVDSEYIRDLVNIYNIPVGELPGPVLYLSDIPFIILLIYWIFEITYKKHKVFFPKSNWAALALLIWAAFSLIHAPVFSYAFFDLLRMVKLYLLYLYVANNIRTTHELKALFIFLLIGVIFQGIFCLFQYLSQDVRYVFGNLFGSQDLYSQEGIEKFHSIFAVYESGSSLKRASGTVGPINAEAQFFEFLLPVALLLWLTAKRFWSRIFHLSVFVFGMLGLAVTFSRGGLIGLLTGIITVLFLSWAFRMLSNKKFLTILIISLFITTAFTPKFYQYMMSRPEAISARFHLMKVGLEMIKANPIMGVGLNNHLIVAPKYDPDTYMLPMPIHNHYLLIASEIGIPGLVFFLGFLFLSFMMVLKSARSNDLYIACISMGIFGAFVAISVHNLVDWLATNTNHTIFWLYGGLAACLSRLNELPAKSGS